METRTAKQTLRDLFTDIPTLGNKCPVREVFVNGVSHNELCFIAETCVCDRQTIEEMFNADNCYAWSFKLMDDTRNYEWYLDFHFGTGYMNVVGWGDEDDDDIASVMDGPVNFLVSGDLANNVDIVNQYGTFTAFIMHWYQQVLPTYQHHQHHDQHHDNRRITDYFVSVQPPASTAQTSSLAQMQAITINQHTPQLDSLPQLPSPPSLPPTFTTWNATQQGDYKTIAPEVETIGIDVGPSVPHPGSHEPLASLLPKEMAVWAVWQAVDEIIAPVGPMYRAGQATCDDIMRDAIDYRHAEAVRVFLFRHFASSKNLPMRVDPGVIWQEICNCSYLQPDRYDKLVA